MLKNFSWLHFSDLHVADANNHDTKDSRESLLSFIEKEKISADYVFITGDIAHQGNYSATTKQYIGRLVEGLQMDGRLDHVFWAAGNHDISRQDEGRNNLLRDMRKKEDGAQRSSAFNALMANKQHRRTLTYSAIADYYDVYNELFGKEFSTGEISKAHRIYEMEDANVVVLNTCLTSFDPNDAHNLFIMEQLLSEQFKQINRDKPTIAIGHHGKDFFEPSYEQVRIGHLFDECVDMYLCGHSHRLGYDVFCDSRYDIHQFTCGGALQDGYSVFSFMYGEYDAEKKAIYVTPYYYSSGGARNWTEGNLHRRLKPRTEFHLERLLHSKKSVDSVFLHELPGFESLVNSAKRDIFISSFFLNSVTESPALKEKILDNQLNVRLLISKRDGVCAKATAVMLDGGNEARYRAKWNTTMMYLQGMYGRGKLPPNLQIRQLDYTFPNRLTAIDAGAEEGQILVVLSAYHNIDEQKAAFVCRQSDYWYSVFSRQMEQMWEDAEPVDLDSLVFD